MRDSLRFTPAAGNVELFSAVGLAPALALTCNSSYVGGVPQQCMNETVPTVTKCGIALFSDDASLSHAAEATAELISILKPIGFVATGTWQSGNLFAALQAAQSIKALGASYAGLATIQPWTTTPDLVALALDGNRLTRLPEGFFVGLPKLEFLYVGDGPGQNCTSQESFCLTERN